MEWGLALLVLLGLGVSAARFLRDGYLPQPFSYDPSDALMDLFNSAYWAQHGGVYEVWRAVYPPLSFVFLRATTTAGCYVGGPFDGRACDGLAKAVLAASWAIDVALVFVVYSRLRIGAAALRALAFGLGLPMLNGMDRGNLVVVTFGFFLLGAADILPERLRWLSSAIAINLKPYLAIVLLPLAIARRWRTLCGVCVAGLLVYLVSYALQGSGSIVQLSSNAAYLFGQTRGHLWNNLYDATGYGPLIAYLRVNQPGVWGAWAEVLRAPMLLGEVGAVACLVMAAVRPNSAPPSRILALGLTTMLTAFGPSGYIEIFLVFLCFEEAWQGPASGIVLVCAYLLCIPADYVFHPVQQAAVHSYWGGILVAPRIGLAAGQVLRPGLVLLIQFGFMALTLADLRRKPMASPAGSAG